MRELMEAVSVLSEMPKLLPNPDDFNLGDHEISKLEYQRLIRSQFNPLKETDQFIIGQTYSDEEGEFFVLDLTKKTVAYTAQYDVYEIDDLGRCCCETLLWKAPDCPVPDITKKIFFGPMMEQFDAIVSDKSHTQAGKQFWIKRMTECAAKGLTVGLMPQEGAFQVFPGGDIQAWVRKLVTWGVDESFEDTRFFITKHKVG
ncbi:MAG: hypothetical protein EOO77_31495 [Oxalobacteraceae bacterium]|nr:MAG: hypothetical protein EOO77_31495 [Oxalobacteraceae bacterium]